MIKINDEGMNREVYFKEDIGITGIELFGYMKNYRALQPIAPHIHDGCIEICCIAKGNQSYYMDGISYELSGGDIFFTEVGKIHSTGDLPEKRTEFYWIQIDVSSPDKFLPLPQSMKSELYKNLLSVSSGIYSMNKQMLILLKQAFDNISSSNLVSKADALGCIIAFLAQLCACTIKEKSISDEIGAALEYINSNIRENIPLSRIAAISHLSLSHFKKKFKAETGYTPGDYIISKKIDLAKSMLQSGLGVTNTAFSLGFSSSSYFAVVFRHYTTISPSNYKKSMTHQNLLQP
jgi:AraC-like DNA-binding protein